MTESYTNTIRAANVTYSLIHGHLQHAALAQRDLRLLATHELADEFYGSSVVKYTRTILTDAAMGLLGQEDLVVLGEVLVHVRLAAQEADQGIGGYVAGYTKVSVGQSTYAIERPSTSPSCASWTGAQW